MLSRPAVAPRPLLVLTSWVLAQHPRASHATLPLLPSTCFLTRGQKDSGERASSCCFCSVHMRRAISCVTVLRMPSIAVAAFHLRAGNAQSALNDDSTHCMPVAFMPLAVEAKRCHPPSRLLLASHLHSAQTQGFMPTCAQTIATEFCPRQYWRVGQLFPPCQHPLRR